MKDAIQKIVAWSGYIAAICGWLGAAIRDFPDKEKYFPKKSDSSRPGQPHNIGADETIRDDSQGGQVLGGGGEA